MVRRGLRGALAEIWKPITAMHFATFETENPSEYCLWQCEQGKTITTAPKAPQSWKELQEKAAEFSLTNIPAYFKNNPEILLLFLIVYPHRMNSDVVKFLDDVYTIDLVDKSIQPTEDGG